MPVGLFLKIKRGLFSAIILLSSSSWACTDLLVPLNAEQKQMCMIECEAYFQKNPDARPASTASICPTAGDRILRVVSPIGQMEQAWACSKGVWQGVLSIPDQMRAYATMAQVLGDNVKQNIKARNEYLNKCQVDIVCRREAARMMIRFRERKPDGSFVVSDAQVDQEIQGRNITELIQTGEMNKESLARSCQSRMSEITRNLNLEEGAWDQARLMRRYQSIIKANPDCPWAMNLKKPEPIPKGKIVPQGPSWLDELGVKLQCYPPEKVEELACLELAKLILDPINLVPVVGLAGKVAAKAGLKIAAEQVAKFGAKSELAHSVESLGAEATETAAKVGSAPAGTTVDRRSHVATVPPDPNLPVPKSSSSKLAKSPQTKLPELVKPDPAIEAAEEANLTKTAKVSEGNPVRAAFTRSYKDSVYTTESQNLKWMDLAKRTNPDGRTVFFDVENSKLKLLNDSLKDKDLVTALTNRHKDLMLQQMEKLKAEFPGLEVYPYSDFKSMRFAFQGKIPPNLQQKLNEVFKNVNSQYSDELLKSKLIREEDRPVRWFRAGYGETADQANITTRYARTVSGDSQVLNFSESHTAENLQTQLKLTEQYRQQVQSDLSGSNLLEPTGDPAKQIPTRDLFDLARKEPDLNTFRQTMKDKFGVSLTETQGQHVQDYVSLVDDFTPGIHSAKREMASLNDAVHGGMSADFAGMGSYNLRQTALGLAKSPDVESALIQTRLGEQEVTRIFKQRMAEQQNKIKNYLDKQQGMTGTKVVCSGDDCVLVASESLNIKQRTELVNRFSKTEDPSGMRVSFVSDKVMSSEDRNILAVHGESMEKYLRKELVKTDIPTDTLKMVSFGVDMQGTQALQGNVKLLIGNSRVPLNREQLTKINEAFARAVQKINSEISSKGEFVSNYLPVPAK